MINKIIAIQGDHPSTLNPLTDDNVLVINNGADYATDDEVTLSQAGGASLIKMKFNNFLDFLRELSWEPLNRLRILS